MTVVHTVPVFLWHYHCTNEVCELCDYSLQKVFPRQGRKVASKRAKAKLVWVFAASISNLSKGQRWEAQWATEQCLEAGGKMFECSEFLPPQALRQAASSEVWTDWKMLQGNSWICKANRQYRQQFVVRSADIVCTARDAKRRCCQLLSTECRTRLPRFWYFFKKVQKARLQKEYKITY